MSVLRNVSQISDVLYVLGNGKIRIKAEGLCQIADLRPHYPSFAVEDLHLPRRRLHHSAENLKGRRLARPIRTDQAENFTAFDF